MITQLRQPNPEQRRFLYGLARTYNLTCTGEISKKRFWEVTLNEWELRWPLVPDLVGWALLPPEVLDGVLSDTQQAIVEAERVAVSALMRAMMKEEWKWWREE
ncbi:hypothetical protein FA13DRAFT_1705202 [Coprinellus micaceus]|uniref:Uncharacterized protein n=1 Tax=Coprinellus micaceus TaxID=71717 RepID=A0A4Y7TWH1_COPMI|nr:hypothetical protein FA13DRAFT_1705202 [Coprinellus micaceus]